MLTLIIRGQNGRIFVLNMLSHSQKRTQIHKQILSPHTTSHQPKNEGRWAEEKMEGKKRK